MLSIHRENLRLRPRERFFTKTLLLSLLAALIVHLSAYLFLDIQTLIIPHMKPTSLLLTLAEITPTQAPTINVRGLPLLEPTPSMPKFESILSKTPSISAPYQTEIAHSNPLSYTPAPSPFAYTYSPITLHIFGNLIMRPIKHNPIPTEYLEAKQTQTRTATFRVQEKEGEIFWLEQQVSTGEPTLDDQAKTLIANLQFEKDSQALITEGFIEIRFTHVEN